MDMVNNQVVIQNNSKGLSFRGIMEVFYKPAELFQALKDNPKILVPYIALILVSVGFFFLIGDLMVKVQLESPQMVERLQGQTPPPQAQQMMKVMGVLFGVIAYCLVPLLIAGLALFFGNFIMGGKATFRQLLSISLYGEILFMVGSLLIGFMMVAKGTMMFSLSLAILAAGEGIQSFAYQALSKISVFHIWEFIVLGIGFSIIYNFKRNKGYILSVLSLGLLAFIHALIALITQLAS